MTNGDEKWLKAKIKTLREACRNAVSRETKVRAELAALKAEHDKLLAVLGGWQDSLIPACADVEEEYDELREILRGIVNNAKYYKHGVWTVTWEQIEKAKKKVEAWDE